MRTSLSPSERDVLRLASYGLPLRWIAAVRGTSIHTVRTQLERARLTLGANGTVHAVAIAIREGAL